MEKAEILELTVNFLKMIREQQVTGLYFYNVVSTPLLTVPCKCQIFHRLTMAKLKTELIPC